MTQESTAHPAGGRWPDPLTELRSQPFPWWSFLVTGTFGVLLGIAVLAWPDITLRIIAALVGIWLFLSGLARIVGAFLPTGGGVAANLLSGIVGVILLIGGILCLRNLVTRLAVLAFIFAVTWILSGVMELIAAGRATGTRRIVLLAAGVISIAGGLIFLFAPNLSLSALILMTGLISLVVGGSEIVLALFLRRAGRGGEAVSTASRPAVA